MTRSITFIRYMASATLGLWLGVGAAQAAETEAAGALDAFYGSWAGSGLSENEVGYKFKLTVRDVDVEIRKIKGGGFSIEWSTVQRKKGDPDNPTEVLKTTIRTFAATDNPLVWREAKSGDPLKGDPLIWARMEETTLILYSFVLEDSGAYEMQVYRRTLDGSGMALEFTRIRDGEPVRTARARLIKTM